MTQLHFIPVDLGSPIVHCSVADPYVVIMTAEGVVTMFVLKTDSYAGKTHRLALQKPHIPSVSSLDQSQNVPPLLKFLAHDTQIYKHHCAYTLETELV